MPQENERAGPTGDERAGHLARRSTGARAGLLLGTTIALGSALLFGTAGCGGTGGTGGTATGEPPETSAAPEEASTMEPTAGGGATPIVCGQPFRPPGPGVLSLTGRFPTAVPAGEPAVTGTVEVSSRRAVRGVAAPRADAFLVRDGRVATVPMAQDALGARWDLTAGQVKRLPGEAGLTACGPGGGPVEPGDYELYARVVLVPDDGARLEVFGGPFPVRVR